MILSFLNKYREGGILLLRVGLGLMLVCAGFPIVAGGSGRWHLAAAPLSQFFRLSHPAFWGGVVAFSEMIGGALLIVGLLSRLVYLLFAIAITFEGIAHLRHHMTLTVASVVFAQMLLIWAALLIGPGKYSVDKD